MSSPTAYRKRQLRCRREDQWMFTLVCLNCRCQYSSSNIRRTKTRERRKRERGGREWVSRQELTKSDMFPEPIRTAFTETSFIQRGQLLEQLIYYNLYYHQSPYLILLPIFNLVYFCTTSSCSSKAAKTVFRLAAIANDCLRGVLVFLWLWLESLAASISIESYSAYINMQQKKHWRNNRESKPSLNSHLAQKVSTLASNRSQDTKSKLQSSRDSYLREFKKPKIKLNTLSVLGSMGIEQQIKKQITAVNDVLRECCSKQQQRKISHSQREDLLGLEQIIRFKDQTIKQLGTEIEGLKKNDRGKVEEDSPNSGHKATDSSDKQPLFKLAQEMKHDREDLLSVLHEHGQRFGSYLKIKKLIEEIEVKYTLKHNGKGRDQNYRGPPLVTYAEFKEKVSIKKEEVPNKIKKIDFYHHLSPQKNNNPSRNMKDLITRKTITIGALKNSRKKHGVQMAQLIAKLDFLKDEDAHLTQKIKEKQQELSSMERKFSERRFEHHIYSRNPLLHFHS